MSNSTLVSQIKKLKTQLKEKNEIAEILHAVDFEQLKIDNFQYLTKIDENNKTLQKFKSTAGKVQQILNNSKVFFIFNLFRKN